MAHPLMGRWTVHDGLRQAELPAQPAASFEARKALAQRHVAATTALALLLLALARHSEIAVSQDLRIEKVTIVSPESAREIDGVIVCATSWIPASRPSRSSRLQP